MAMKPSTTNPSALLALADRCEREESSLLLDELIYTTVFTVDELNHDLQAPLYTRSLDAAVTLVPEGWLLITLSEIAGDGLSFCKLANTESPVKESIGFGSKTLALDVCAAALRARSALTKPEGE